MERAAPPGLRAGPGLEGAGIQGRHFAATLSGSVQPLLDALAGKQVTTMLVEDPDLEDAFLDLYAGDA